MNIVMPILTIIYLIAVYILIRIADILKGDDEDD